MGLFSFLQTPKSELQLYGKLPIAKDYLRIGLSDEVGLGWRSWLDQHFSSGVERGEPMRLSWPVGFVLGAEAGDPLIGCMWNSSDAGGHRKFPFTLAVHRKRKDLGKSLSGGMTGALAAWNRLEEFRARALTCANGEQLMEELRGRELPLETVYPHATSHVSFNEWCDALWPAAGRRGLHEAQDQLRAAFSDPSIRSLRLALSPALGWAEQVQAWCRLVERTGWMGVVGSPNIFVHDTTKSGPSEESSTAAAPALLISRDPLCAADAFRLCGVEEEWGSQQTLELGARSGASTFEDTGPTLYPVEGSLSQAMAEELGH